MRFWAMNEAINKERENRELSNILNEYETWLRRQVSIKERVAGDDVTGKAMAHAYKDALLKFQSIRNQEDH